MEGFRVEMSWHLGFALNISSKRRIAVEKHEIWQNILITILTEKCLQKEFIIIYFLKFF